MVSRECVCYGRHSAGRNLACKVPPVQVHVTIEAGGIPATSAGVGVNTTVPLPARVVVVTVIVPVFEITTLVVLIVAVGDV